MEPGRRECAPAHVPGSSPSEAPHGAGRWYVVRTQPQREEGVRARLEAQGFTVFLPQVLRTVRHARKLRTKKAALFPSYLFIRLDVGNGRWRAVNGTIGAVGLVMAHELPAPVPAGVVEDLLRRVGHVGLVRLDVDLKVGHAVEVLAGPFANVVGDLVRLDASGRVQVLLHLLNGVVPATLERSALRAA